MFKKNQTPFQTYTKKNKIILIHETNLKKNTGINKNQFNIYINDSNFLIISDIFTTKKIELYIQVLMMTTQQTAFFFSFDDDKYDLK